MNMFRCECHEYCKHMAGGGRGGCAALLLLLIGGYKGEAADWTIVCHLGCYMFIMEASRHDVNDCVGMCVRVYVCTKCLLIVKQDEGEPRAMPRLQ